MLRRALLILMCANAVPVAAAGEVSFPPLVDKDCEGFAVDYMRVCWVPRALADAWPIPADHVAGSRS